MSPDTFSQWGKKANIEGQQKIFFTPSFLLMGLPIWKPRDRDDNIRSKDNDGSNICRTSRRPMVFSARQRPPSLLAGSDTRARAHQAAMANRRSRALTLALRGNIARISPASRSSRSSSAQQREQISDENLDRLVQQRFDEKEDLLNQLEFTVTLLDQFLATRATLGSDSIAIPSFITEGNVWRKGFAVNCKAKAGLRFSLHRSSSRTCISSIFIIIFFLFWTRSCWSASWSTTLFHTTPIDRKGHYACPSADPGAAEHAGYFSLRIIIIIVIVIVNLSFSFSSPPYFCFFKPSTSAISSAIIPAISISADTSTSDTLAICTKQRWWRRAGRRKQIRAHCC